MPSLYDILVEMIFGPKTKAKRDKERNTEASQSLINIYGNAHLYFRFIVWEICYFLQHFRNTIKQCYFNPVVTVGFGLSKPVNNNVFYQLYVKRTHQIRHNDNIY